MAKEYKIKKEHWFCLDIPGMPLKKVGSHLSISALEKQGDDEKDKYEQSIRILKSSNGDSTPIMEMPQSLMRVLSDNSLYTLRLYVLFPEDMDKKAIRKQSQEINRTIHKELPDVKWK